ncbi:hypothetical protein [Occultella kanbiaonis]|uniref:hypothetical protein n=1 Tax=Occultella kanbiaonis TaxID=2675754 RepID=UPI0012B82518|nr:hypothetical protein [Occultella kanbiaonis]
MSRFKRSLAKMGIASVIAASVLGGHAAASAYSIGSGNFSYDGGSPWQTILTPRSVSLTGTSTYTTYQSVVQFSFASDYRRYRTLQPTQSLIRVDRMNTGGSVSVSQPLNFGTTTVFGNYIANYDATVRLSAHN